jgi:hypothetical protein
MLAYILCTFFGQAVARNLTAHRRSNGHAAHCAIEFGRFAALSRQRCGERRPETFAFLGFTHYCGRTRDGRFIVKHKTEGKRLTRKLTALRQEAWRLMHAPLATQHEWSATVLRGHYGYYGTPHNYPALNGFYRDVRRTWLRCLRWRSQKSP